MSQGKLVFAAGNFADYNIFLYDLSSQKLTQLTSDDAWNDYPRFSPDSKTLVYTSSSVDKADARITFCACGTDKITVLKFDEGPVKRELERTFVADMNRPLPANLPPFQENKMDKRLESMGEHMLSEAGRMTPGTLEKLLIKFGQKYEQKCEQVEIDRINTITTRYIDWK